MCDGTLAVCGATTLSEVWYNFDFDGDGTISEHEFAMKGGLWEMLMEQGAGQVTNTGLLGTMCFLTPS